MRLTFISTWVIVLLFSCGWTVVYAQSDRNVEPGLQCVERLEIPPYPPIARSARFSGTARVKIQLKRGSPARFEIEGVHPILQEAVESAMQASELSTNCDINFEILFTFRIEGVPTDRWELGTVAFKSPNQFVISVHPPTPQP
jgi:hypothetical protein